ncbi:RNA methyltransferase [Pseudorhodoplanes sp.]|uniref:class I SAM-dependent RNA methyltransferase n=1 Tax=Pseudorhodoplanes sp. TaxID=1934341 RepID=UPI002C2EB11D|nr:RNA methyltransferase [Pseudorhodoplanes sp.]HWV43624.1 RNA methyltransferase [Pseudorhodoplanes sp.]
MVDRLIITDIGHRGDGVAPTPDGPVFVPYTLPGETVDADAVQGHPDRRHLLHVVEASPDRVAPFCPHFGVCGGCAIQHWAEPRYRAWKRDLVVSALSQAGVDAQVGDLIDAHGEGRRRAVLHARQGTKEIVEVGFSALRAHTLVPIDRCPVLAPGMAVAIDAAWAIADVLGPLKKPLDIHVTATLNGLDIDVRGSGPLDQARASALARVAASGRIARITRHGEMIAQIAPPLVQMGKAKVTLPPGPFLQATALGEQTLAELVLDHVGNAKSALDLFCGLGPFSLRLAERIRVTAIDSDQAAIEALARAAQATPGLKQVTALRRDLFRLPRPAMDLVPFEAVVFDPPRQGAEAQAREIAKSKVKTVVAVSCNAGTFARDAAILMAGGYKLSRVTPVDQFKYTAHVEIVARFAR